MPKDLRKEPNSLCFGKSWEYRIMSELLKRNFDVYAPLVDDKGIDCLIRKGNKYIDIQIKARNRKRRYNISEFMPRKNYYFAFAREDNKGNENVYIISSINLKKLIGNNDHLIFSDKKMEKYKNKFETIK